MCCWICVSHSRHTSPVPSRQIRRFKIAVSPRSWPPCNLLLKSPSARSPLFPSVQFNKFNSTSVNWASAPCKGLSVKYHKEWASVFLLCGFSVGEGSSLPFPRRAKAISSVTGNRSTAPGCFQCLCSLPSLTSPCWVFVHLPEHAHTLTSIRVSRADRPSCFHFLSTSFRLIDHTLLSFSLIWKRHQQTINIWWQVGTEEKEG